MAWNAKLSWENKTFFQYMSLDSFQSFLKRDVFGSGDKSQSYIL